MSDDEGQFRDPKKGSGRERFYEAMAGFLEGQQGLQKQQIRELKYRPLKWVIPMVVVALYLLGSLSYSLWFKDTQRKKDHVAIVRVEGVIAPDSSASFAVVSRSVTAAFDDEKAVGVALVINSPGGSPAQSQMIYEMIRRLKLEKKKKVVAFGEDFVASGAYYIAAAADKIFVPSTSIVGSIGVAQDGYDLSEIAKKYGVKSRNLTAGDHKRRFDPLQPLSDDDIAKSKEFLGEMHEEFIAAVIAGRGDRIDSKKNPDLFSGDFWTGKHALTLGLVDGLDPMPLVLEKEFGTKETFEYYPTFNYTDLVKLISKH